MYTAISASRNIEGYAFMTNVESEERAEVEDLLVNAVADLGLAGGEYFKLEEIPDDEAAFLVADGAIFAKPAVGSMLKASGAARDWPSCRGSFFDRGRERVVWINEEDHLRVITKSGGGDVKRCLGMFQDTMKAIELKLQADGDDGHFFVASERLGYLTTWPARVGTAMTVSMRLKVAGLAGFRSSGGLDGSSLPTAACVTLLERACAALGMMSMPAPAAVPASAVVSPRRTPSAPATARGSMGALEADRAKSDTAASLVALAVEGPGGDGSVLDSCDEFVLSSCIRLGLTEVETVQHMINGVCEIIRMSEGLEKIASPSSTDIAAVEQDINALGKQFRAAVQDAMKTKADMVRGDAEAAAGLA
jgi:protein-arginine kinase